MKTSLPKDRSACSHPLPRMLPPLFTEAVRGANVGVSQLRGSGVNEAEARRLMALRGYRIHSGAVWFITNDDTDQGIEETLIANWDGTAADALANLESHEWPTSPFILCMACSEGEAEFGGYCDRCSREVVEWIKAGEYM